MLKQTKDCPKCKESIGWYENVRKSYSQYYTANGASSFATDGSQTGGVRKYCYNCNLDITNRITDEKD